MSRSKKDPADDGMQLGGGGAKAPSTHEEPLLAPGISHPGDHVIAPEAPDPAWPTPKYRGTPGLVPKMHGAMWEAYAQILRRSPEYAQEADRAREAARRADWESASTEPIPENEYESVELLGQPYLVYYLMLLSHRRDVALYEALQEQMEVDFVHFHANLLSFFFFVYDFPQLRDASIERCAIHHVALHPWEESYQVWEDMWKKQKEWVQRRFG